MNNSTFKQHIVSTEELMFLLSGVLIFFFSVFMSSLSNNPILKECREAVLFYSSCLSSKGQNIGLVFLRGLLVTCNIVAL